HQCATISTIKWPQVCHQMKHVKMSRVESSQHRHQPSRRLETLSAHGAQSLGGCKCDRGGHGDLESACEGHSILGRRKGTRTERTTNAKRVRPTTARPI